MATVIRKRGKHGTVWDDLFYVRTYELCRSGIKGKANIARALGVDVGTFNNWLKTKPALLDAFKRGGKVAVDNFTFKDFLYNRLPPALQQLWRKIDACDDTPDGTLQLAELMGGVSTRQRQRIFLYALVNSGFNQTDALHRVGIPRRTLRDWVANDPDFADLLVEIDEAKKDFFEDALMDLVRARETSATIFVNKTYNRDRGYGETKRVEVSGTVQHQHFLVKVDELNLPLEMRMQLLDAVRAARGDRLRGAVDGRLLEVHNEVGAGPGGEV